MLVKQLAKLMAVTPDTVRYYTRVKLLNPMSSDSNGYHQYSPADQKRLRFILSARQLGFSVKDIQNIIQESEQGNCPCPLTRKLISQRLLETEALFQETLKGVYFDISGTTELDEEPIPENAAKARRLLKGFRIVD